MAASLVLKALRMEQELPFNLEQWVYTEKK